MPRPRPARKPEIMSPAGYWPQLHAAVEAGADAVYFGLRHFSARAKVGFGLDELPAVMRTLHRRGVRGYVTFNTLVFEHELDQAAQTLAALAHAGADALIVQDLGIVRLARQLIPGMELHASTQMSITSAAGVRLAQESGLHRVTLARELSLAEVRAIVDQTECELEIFVHGALCVAYSGQCFSSEAWGGRSANRGQCAQACRLPYELLVDGAMKPLGDARYLLSPGDLFALHQIPEIIDAGVAALKIEGRYKDENYVALTTSAYRQAVDDAWAGRALSVGRERELELAQVYSRGFGPFFLSGTDHQAVVRGRAPRHRGVLMGRVAAVTRDSVFIQPDQAHRVSPLKPGDGVVFDAADWRSPEEPEEGGRLYEVIQAPNGSLELRFGNREIRSDRIRPGDLLWRTDDPSIERAARPFTRASAPVARQPVHVRVTAAEGAPLVTEWSLPAQPSIQVTVLSPESLPKAQSHGLSPEALRENLGRLGNSPYSLSGLDAAIEGAPFAPASLLNRIRREAVEGLERLQTATHTAAAAEPHTVLQSLLSAAPTLDASAPPELHLLVRTPDQLDAALDLAPASITLDYLDLFGLRPSIERIKTAAIPARVASPRIFKPGEERILDFLLSLDCPILIRSAGLLHALRGKDHAPLTGDFSLNAANSIAARALLGLGLSRLTPTHDLNAEQVAQLARDIGPDSCEAVLWQHLPVFHTEHCVFCRFLSTGTSHKDCGRPCDTHRLALRDSSGRAHPVIADAGCRNTVFGAEAQQASAHIGSWLGAGIRHFRLEFAHESARQVRDITRLFASALASPAIPPELAADLKRAAPEGITEGSLFVPAGYLTLPVLQ